jgi:hypothetical protein
MPRRLIAGVAGVVLLVAAGCGGGSTSVTKTTKTLSERQAGDLVDTALFAAQDIDNFCLGESSDHERMNKAVDRLVDAYRSSQWNRYIRQEVRAEANSLRDCDEDAQADRLSDLADAH